MEQAQGQKYRFFLNSKNLEDHIDYTRIRPNGVSETLYMIELSFISRVHQILEQHKIAEIELGSQSEDLTGAIAKYNLAYSYFYGKGAPRSGYLAFRYFSDAKKLGNGHSAEALRNLDFSTSGSSESTHAIDFSTTFFRDPHHIVKCLNE